MCNRKFRAFQDPPPSEDDLQKYRRRRDAGAEESEPYEDEEDDSDMFMEPMELTKTEVAASPTASTEQPEVSTETSSIKATKDNQEMGQHFFPSFAPVFSLGHSRPHQLFHQVYPQVQAKLNW